MAAIDFTGLLRFRSAVPVPINFGRVQRPETGGAAYRTDRRGNRWAFRFETPRMNIEPEGRRLQAMFDDAERLGGIFPIEQPDFDVGAPGSPVLAANYAVGRNLPLAALTPHYAIRAGWWCSVIVDGQRYLDRVMDQAIAEADGTATIRLKNLIRVPMTEGCVVEIAQPKIQGTVELEPPAWEVDRMTSFAFTVTEDR